MPNLNVRSNINPNVFPHVDLGEPSSRAGVAGYRYVPLNGGSRLGDTNTGRIVYPRIEEGPSVDYVFDDDTQMQDQISIVDG